ncbi:MAG TPA: LuxR C-terminal-related transcriptional regulator [Candidatus Baltobacteraceae bacterium]
MNASMPEPTRAAQRLRTLLVQRQLVLVQAPLGYGKTTTARLALAGDERVAWYGAQPWERGAFIVPLVNAVRVLRPDFGRLTLALAEHQNISYERLGATFAADLEHVREPLTIVVDDCHHFGEDAGFGPFIDGVMRSLPAYVHVVLLSRAFPAFGLAELLANDRAAIIGIDDLRFDADDVARLAQRLDVALQFAEAEQLNARVEGWPAGVVLTLKLGEQRVPSSGGSLSAATAYLVDRLLVGLSPDMVAALERVCVFEVVEPALFADDERAPIARAMLELERGGSMVHSLDEGKSYRVHPLLRDAVTRRLLAQTDGGALANLHEHAGRLYARAGRSDAALFHLQRADRSVPLVWFLRDYAAKVIAQGRGEEIAQLVARLRARGVDEEAVFSLVDGLLAKSRGGDIDLRAAFALAADLAQARGDETILYAARAQLVEHDLGRGRPVTAEAIEDLLARSRSRGEFDRAVAAIRAGWFDVLAGSFERAIARVGTVADDGSPEASFYLVPLRAYSHTVLGEFETAQRLVSGMLDRLAGSDAIVLYAISLIWAARLAILRAETAEAFEYACEARRVAQPFALRAEAAALAVVLAESASHTGDAALTLEAAREARRFADAAWYVHDGERARSSAARYEARSLFLRGDITQAFAVAQDSAAHVPDAGQRLLSAADAATYASLLRHRDASRLRAEVRTAVSAVQPYDAADAAAFRDAADLLEFFESLESGAEHPIAFTGGAFEAMIERRVVPGRLSLLAIALRNVRERKESPDAFAAGLRLVTSRGPRFEAAVMRAAAASDAPATMPRGTRSMIDDLTPREREILALLATGLTNREIAQRFVLSTRTVETHVARVLGKLGVSSRARAIAQAAAFGLTREDT